MAARNIPKKEYVPPPPTPRQAEKIKLEQEAGARRIAAAQELDNQRIQPPVDPTEGTSTPVFRPRDFVPKHGSKDPAIETRNLK